MTESLRQLVKDFADYEYSRGSFYEKGIKKYKNQVHIMQCKGFFCKR